MKKFYMITKRPHSLKLFAFTLLKNRLTIFNMFYYSIAFYLMRDAIRIDSGRKKESGNTLKQKIFALSKRNGADFVVKN